MKNALGLGRIGLLILTAASVGHAQVWTTAASSCALDEGSLSVYEASFGALRFDEDATGTLVARCNVTNPADDGADPGWDTLEASYADRDGRGNRAMVAVRLRRQPNGSGTASNIATVDSEVLGGSSAVQARSVTFAHSFDFDGNAYYIDILLRRATEDSDFNPAVVNVRLRRAAP